MEKYIYIKNHTKTIYLEYQLQPGIKNDLPDGLNSVSDVQDYFEYILKNTEKRLVILQ